MGPGFPPTPRPLLLLQSTTAVGQLPKHVHNSRSDRAKRDAFAIRGPDWEVVPSAFKRRLRQLIQREVVDPNVSALFQNRHGHTPSIRGNSRVVVGVGRRGQRLLGPILEMLQATDEKATPTNSPAFAQGYAAVLDREGNRQVIEGRRQAVVAAYEKLRDVLNPTETRFEKIEF